MLNNISLVLYNQKKQRGWLYEKKFFSLLVAIFVFASIAPSFAGATEQNTYTDENLMLLESDFLLNVDLNQQEDLVSNGNSVIQSRFALPFPVYFIPGIGQVTLLGTGVVVGGGVAYEASSWIAEMVNSYLAADTADEIISKKKKGSIRKEFPSEYLDKTLNEIEKDAKAGKPRAKKAKKLLTDKRFDK